jgi:hypothetical protein
MHILKGGTVDLPAPEGNKPWTPCIEGYQARLRSMVETSELFHVSAEMTAIADEAGRTMPGYRLHREDLPAESGLIVFDAPIGTATHADIAANPHNGADVLHLAMANATGDKLPTIRAVAAMWRFALTRGGEPGVLVTLWTSNYDMATQYEAGGNSELAEAIRQQGWLGYHDETVLPFGDIVDDETTDPENPKPIGNDALRTLISTWLLMDQPIVSTEPEPLPRQIRRAIQRSGREVPTVRVVKLRPAKRPPQLEPEDPGNSRNYQHRWVVRGHWRNQWYPSRSDHKPIYVPTHLKGPEGAPFAGAEKVFDWSR